MTQRYLVAKYAPDIFRMEPRNIGVILWADGQVSAKFLERKDASFVREKDIYERWIKFWNRLVQERSIKNGKIVSANDPAFLDAFAKTQEGNFMLLDAGRVHDKIEAEDIHVATDFLFTELVSPLPYAESESSAADSLSRLCDSLFEETGLRHRPDCADRRYCHVP